MTRELTVNEIIEQATGRKPKSMGSREDFFESLREQFATENATEQPVDESRYEALRQQIKESSL